MQTLPYLLVAITLPALAADPQITFADLMAVRTASSQALSRDGRWLVVTTLRAQDRLGVNNHRFGDPSYDPSAAVEASIVDTRIGTARKLFEGSQKVSRFAWSPDGRQLAYFSHGNGACVIWNRESGKSVSVPGVVAALNASPTWTPDSSTLLIPNRTAEWNSQARERFLKQVEAPVVVHSSKQPFLPWEDLRRMNADRGLVAYEVASGTARVVLPVGRYNQHALTDDGAALVLSRDITSKTDYDVIFGAENEVVVRGFAGGSAERKIIASTKGMNMVWSGDGRRYAYLKEGKLFTASIEDKEARQIAGRKGDKKAEEDKDKKDETFTPVRLSFTGSKLVASNKQGLWLLDSDSGAKEQIVKTPEDDKTAPRYAAAGWSPDGDSIYLSYSARAKWERGLLRYRVATKRLEELFKDANVYQGFEWSHDGSTLVFSSSTGNRPLDIWTANADGTNRRRMIESNPQLKASQLGRTELVGYLNADGNPMQGVLYYPLGYEPGRKYPAVFSIYEDFYDDAFRNDIALLNAHGYAVMQPSVDFETGFPGEAWVKSVTSAANKLVDMGVADPAKLGVHGVSYGGYATNLLITQTNRFKAAINISGKVNMISFYTDSPRLGIRNIHAPEKSQDRLGATLWQQPQKYIAHSAIMFADRIKTPLLLITGEQDHNVPARQAMEMFYALRRLGKEVEWVSYTNSGHGAPSTNAGELNDYLTRMLAWYDSHLKNPVKEKKETD